MKHLMRLFMILSAVVLGAFGTNYKLDISHSNVGFKVKHMMISNVKGNFYDYDGVIAFDEKKGVFTKLSATISADSINTENEKRDKHLTSKDFFDAETYPDITFIMTKQEGDTIYGKLTIRDITKTIALELDMGGVVQDPWGNKRLGFALEGKINRKEFNILWNKSLDSGGVVVGDTVKLLIDIEGIAK